MSVVANQVVRSAFNRKAQLPFALRLQDFEIAMQDVYDFFFDVNQHLANRSLERLDDMLRPANMSGMLSDMLTASVGKHSRTLVPNQYHNGHPDLILKGKYANNSIKSGTDGVEIKTTRKASGAVDTHGAREQWMCVFVYSIDNVTEPAVERRPMTFTEIYLHHVSVSDFRKNARGELGTRTATLDRKGIGKLRESWIYLLDKSTSR
jgi:hypothetical protein